MARHQQVPDHKLRVFKSPEQIRLHDLRVIRDSSQVLRTDVVAEFIVGKPHINIRSGAPEPRKKHACWFFQISFAVSGK